MIPIDFFKKNASNGGSPQELVMRAMAGNNSNPMTNNLIEMAKKGDSKGVENFARNLMKEQGRDFDKEFSEFMSQIKR